MRPNERERVPVVFYLTAEELLNYLKEVLKAYGYKPVKAEEYLFAEGKEPVLMVAHVDTVHKWPPVNVFYDPAAEVLWSPEGLGADDRAGVLGILWLLKQGRRPWVLFTDGEEAGGTGAKAAARDLAKEVLPVKFVVELDRKNGTEAVFYGCDNAQFKKFILGFGFKEAEGSFTDISILCPAWGVAGVNLSCGYYNAHRETEFLRLGELREVVNKVAVLLRAAEGVEKFAYVPREARYTFRGHGDFSVLPAGYSWYLNRYSSYNHEWLRGNYVLYVDLDPEELAREFGGTPETWEEVLDMLSRELEEEAKAAVWSYLEIMFGRRRVR